MNKSFGYFLPDETVNEMVLLLTSLSFSRSASVGMRTAIALRCAWPKTTDLQTSVSDMKLLPLIASIHFTEALADWKHSFCATSPRALRLTSRSPSGFTKEFGHTLSFNGLEIPCKTVSNALYDDSSKKR